MEFVLPSIIIFIGMFLTDVCWTFYLLKVEERKSLQASVWAMFLYLMGAFVITSYVDNKWLIIPAALGSFLGTYVVLEYKKKLEKNENK